MLADDVVGDVKQLLGPSIDDRTDRVVDSNGGQTVLLLREGELPTLSAFFHDRTLHCGGFWTYATAERAEERVKIDPRSLERTEVDEVLTPSETEVITKLLPKLEARKILTTIETLSAFPSRYYKSTTGVDAANWLHDHWTELAAGRADVTVDLFSHPGWPQPSVIMRIPGKDLPDEEVIIGGHLDSIAFGGGNAPGADDDASGIATITDVARVLLAENVKLKRTVTLIGYSAEEAGLRGSEEIVADYKARNAKVTAVMQLDMTNFKGSMADIVLFEDFTDPAQTDFAQALVAAYLPGITVTRDECGYACSDHASWFVEGFKTVLPFESQMGEYNPTIHSSQDTLAQSGNKADHAFKFAKLALAWAVETADVSDGGQTPAGKPQLLQVAYDIPGVDSVGEFVEIRNTGGQQIDLTGYSLRDNFGAWKFPAGTRLEPNAVMSIATNAAGFKALYGKTADIGGLGLSLGNANDEVSLRDAASVTVDFVAWERTGWPLNAPTGKSIVRTAQNDTDLPADWSVLPTAPIGGLP